MGGGAGGRRRGGRCRRPPLQRDVRQQQEEQHQEEHAVRGRTGRRWGRVAGVTLTETHVASAARFVHAHVVH